MREDNQKIFAKINYRWLDTVGLRNMTRTFDYCGHHMLMLAPKGPPDAIPFFNNVVHGVYAATLYKLPSHHTTLI